MGFFIPTMEIVIKAKTVDSFFERQEDDCEMWIRRKKPEKAEQVEKYNSTVIHCLGIAAVANFLHRQGIGYEPLWDSEAPYQLEVFNADGYMEPVKVCSYISRSAGDFLVPMYKRGSKGEEKQGSLLPVRYYVPGLRLSSWWGSCRVLQKPERGSSVEVAFDGIADRETVDQGREEMRAFMAKVVPVAEIKLPDYWSRGLLPVGVDPHTVRTQKINDMRKNLKAE
jgi:hypothetical protein